MRYYVACQLKLNTNYFRCSQIKRSWKIYHNIELLKIRAIHVCCDSYNYRIHFWYIFMLLYFFRHKSIK